MTEEKLNEDFDNSKFKKEEIFNEDDFSTVKSKTIDPVLFEQSKDLKKQFELSWAPDEEIKESVKLPEKTVSIDKIREEI